MSVKNLVHLGMAVVRLKVLLVWLIIQMLPSCTVEFQLNVLIYGRKGCFYYLIFSIKFSQYSSIHRQDLDGTLLNKYPDVLIC